MMLCKSYFKKVLRVFIVSFIIHCHLVCMETAAEKKHIIFDPLFLVQPDFIEGMKAVGTLNAGKMFIGSLLSTKQDPKKLQQEFFAEMKQINPIETPRKVFYQDEAVPYVIYSFLVGEKTPEETLTTVRDHIKGRPREKLLELCAEMTFDPKKNATIMKAIPAVIDLLYQLRSSGHTIHLLGNWNSEVFKAVKKKMSAFEFINGEILISGNLKTPKGSSMFGSLFDNHSVDPEKTIVVEPYSQVAQELRETYPAVTVIDCKSSSDLKRIEKELTSYGALA